MQMKWIPFMLAALLPAVAFGQLAARPDQAPGEEPPEGPKVVELTVRPAAVPRCSLSVSLLPPLPVRVEGNAALQYDLAMQVFPEIDRSSHPIDDWLTGGPKLPPEATEFLSRQGGALRYMYLGAIRTDCDWQLPVRSEGVSMLLPPLSKLRTLAKLLALRCQAELANDRFGDAEESLQTMYALSRNLCDEPTLIQALVGIAIAGLASERLHAWQQCEEAPNLYWALAQLPPETISMRKGFEYESSWLMLEPDLSLAIKPGKVTREEADRIVLAMRKTAGYLMGEVGPKLGGDGLLMATALKNYAPAKAFLKKRGYSDAEIEELPVLAVVGMYSSDVFRHWRDRLFQWHNLPYWQVGRQAQETNTQFQAFSRENKSAGWPFLAFLPSVDRARWLETRAWRQLRAIQTVEAVRAYAAGHGGKTPKTLGEIEDTPAPIDPATGKMFDYRTTDKGFEIRALAPEWERVTDGFILRVTMSLDPAPAPKETQP